MHLQARVTRAANLLAKNPALFCRVALAKLNTRRPMPALPARRFIRDVAFECNLEDYRGAAPMYFGSYALLIVEAMKHYLKPGDVFIDVGANIGYLSAVAAGLVGTSGQVHSFEPAPAYHKKLCMLARLNPRYSISANACALGEAAGQSTIYITREPGQNTLIRAYKKNSEIVSEYRVNVVRLDSYLETHKIRRVSLIKIDAEGFELFVLKGMQRFLEGSSDRPAIICEVAPRAYSLLGRRIGELTAFMERYGYGAYDLIDGSTPVDLASLRHVDDVLFLHGGK